MLAMQLLHWGRAVSDKANKRAQIKVIVWSGKTEEWDKEKKRKKRKEESSEFFYTSEIKI